MLYDNICSYNNLDSSMQTKFLQSALREAAQARGLCAPNPAVGAVIVYQGKVVATGFHAGPGKPHAEVVAIKNSPKQDFSNCELYVTLEPCAHFGRTPPCADLIIQKGFKAVYYGYKDPNPLVAGKGAAKIQAAGIQCTHQSFSEINEFYQSYQWWTHTKKAFITAKIAISLDGKIAAEDSVPVKLSGKSADEFTHQCRLKTDAILSSIKTVNQDDPAFNARVSPNPVKKNLFLIGANTQLNLNRQIFKTANQITLLVPKSYPYDPTELSNLNREVLSGTEDKIDLTAIPAYLGQLGLQDVWLECGATLLNEFMQLKLLNRLYVYVSPKLLGSSACEGFFKVHELPEPRWMIKGSDAVARFDFE